MSLRFFSQNIWNEAAARFEPGVLEVGHEKIESLQFGKPEGSQAKKKILDLDDLHIGPSAIDLHVHSRDFQESHKETLETCEASAFKGGVATLTCMANTRPRIDSVETVKNFVKLADKRWARFIPFASVTKNLEGKEATDWNALLRLPIAGLSDDGRPLLDEKLFRGALLATKKSKRILSLHEEDIGLSKCSVLNLSETSMRLGIEGSPAEGESKMVERDLRIAEELKAPIHFGHISTEASVKLIRAAKKRGAQVSAELTPHHGLLEGSDAEDLPLQRLSSFKVCPPIRSANDRSALRKAVTDGVLDCFASDHAPHSGFEKNLSIDQAAHGLIGMEYFFPLYNELRLQASLSWKVFYAALCSRPASLLPGVPKIGHLKPGFEASFMIFDPSLSQTLKWSTSKSSNSLFEAKKIRGVIFQHWIRGKKVYDIR